MNNEKIIEINGRKIPVGRVKHWQYAPWSIEPFRSELETIRWMALERLCSAWNSLDPDPILEMLGDGFAYGSYWVRNELDLAGYRRYLPGKFKTFREKNKRPSADIVVLYAGLTPMEFPYALRIVHGETVTLLTLQFSGASITSLYMTDPEIFTYEPTFAKGGIVESSGEPRVFHHQCVPSDAGREMKDEEFHAFAVECVFGLFREAHVNVCGVHTNTYKEFPSIVTQCGCDRLFHRVDVALPCGDGTVCEVEADEYVAAAAANDAMPLVMPVSLYCSETNGGAPVCGGSFFMKVGEARLLGGDYAQS